MGRGAAIGPAALPHVGVRTPGPVGEEPSRRVGRIGHTHTGRWLAGCRLAASGRRRRRRRGGRFPPSCPLPLALAAAPAPAPPNRSPLPFPKAKQIRCGCGLWPMNAQWLSSLRNRLALGWVGSFWNLTGGFTSTGLLLANADSRKRNECGSASSVAVTSSLLTPVLVFVFLILRMRRTMAYWHGA